MVRDAGTLPPDEPPADRRDRTRTDNQPEDEGARDPNPPTIAEPELEPEATPPPAADAGIADPPEAPRPPADAGAPVTPPPTDPCEAACLPADRGCAQMRELGEDCVTRCEKTLVRIETYGSEACLLAVTERHFAHATATCGSPEEQQATALARQQCNALAQQTDISELNESCKAHCNALGSDESCNADCTAALAYNWLLSGSDCVETVLQASRCNAAELGPCPEEDSLQQACSASQ